MRVLAVDDNIDVIKSLENVLEEHEIIGTNSIKNAKKILETEAQTIDVAIIDIMLENEDGLELLSFIKSTYPLIECIMISGYASIEKAVLSIKLGAFDFIEKPISYQKLKVILNNAMEHKNYRELLSREIEKYRLIGTSSAIKEINAMIEKAAKIDYPVLIYGESGVGKEHIAHLVHLKSKRGKNEMVKLNCAAIPETLFESEFFGYEKGAFTGANNTRKGKFELAHQSTLFLDEIGEMPLSQQAKLLRVLEEKSITRIGGTKSIPVDFRLISATNKNLKDEVKNNTFREDLFYRISVLVIEIPPLRERKEDIIPLAKHFFKQICLENNVKDRELTSDALEFISSLPLKGNIRELKNLIQRIFAFSDINKITVEDVKKILDMPRDLKPSESIFEKTMPLSEAKKFLEKQYILTQLKIHGNNISKTAIDLGVLPNNLMRKMKELEIKIDSL
jgi:two-component system nitrogen regulation response regulator NtrX